MPVSKTCLVCLKNFTVIPQRADTAKYCSRECSAKSKLATPNVTCTFCGTAFHMKAYQQNRYNRVMGYFCSKKCASEEKKTFYEGDQNPNYKGINKDACGYFMESPSTRRELGVDESRIHRIVCCISLGVRSIHKSLHVHHRDCDITNNTVENLAVMNASDHKWLHKQFGNAGLWAYAHSKVSLNTLLEWTNDTDRAARLLNLRVDRQTIESIGVVKDGELLENLEADNQQPSSESNLLEGSETRDRVVPVQLTTVISPRAPSTLKV